MAFIYIDDAAPEGDEYISNYRYFDEKQTGAVEKVFRCMLKNICVRSEKMQNKPGYEYVVEIG